MNEKNYEYLKGQLKYTGFGESLQEELKQKLQQQPKEFKIYHKQELGQDYAAATLHFRQSDQSDMYFFNKYDLLVKNQNSEDVAKQTFYMGKDNNVTLKEGFNLLQGRAVKKDLNNKEGERYNAWMQLNFKETEPNGNYVMNKYHQNYGFNLETELSKIAIKELGNAQDKERLINSLEKGNRQSVTFIKDGQEQKMFIEANPKFKTVNVYDQHMKRVQNQVQREGKSTEQSTKQDSRQEKARSADEGDSGPAAPKKSRKKKQSIS